MINWYFGSFIISFIEGRKYLGHNIVSIRAFVPPIWCNDIKGLVEYVMLFITITNLCQMLHCWPCKLWLSNVNRRDNSMSHILSSVDYFICVVMITILNLRIRMNITNPMNQRNHMNVHYQYYWSTVCPKCHYENKVKPNVLWTKNIIEKREIVKDDRKV